MKMFSEKYSSINTPFLLLFYIRVRTDMRLGCGTVTDNRGSIPGTGKIFFFSAVFIPVLGPNQAPIQSILGGFSLAVTLPELESDHSRHSIVSTVKCMELYLHSHVFMVWCLIKHRTNLFITEMAVSFKL
jgi:hypothetical protein